MKSPSGAAAPRLYILDGLRLVAAVLVVAFHFRVFSKPWGNPPSQTLPTLSTYTQFGWLGVFFFLISGFVICMSAEGRGLSQRRVRSPRTAVRHGNSLRTPVEPIQSRPPNA